MSSVQREFTEKHVLLDTEGHIIANGWCGNTLLEYRRDSVPLIKRLFRLRECERYIVSSSDYQLILSIRDNGYFGMVTATIASLSGESETTTDIIVPFPFGRMELPAELEDTVTKAFSGVVTTLLTSLGTALSSVAGAIPRILLFIVITVISAIYFALDLEKINYGVRRILPAPLFKLLAHMKNGALTLGVKYLRSYFLIMLMTFSIMLTGLLILRVEYAFLFAIIIAILDLLPIIGVGTALVPASVFCFLSGNRGLGIGLIILFLVNEAVRQFAEPRILGRHLGIHPLATLASIYIGYSFFGFAGIFLLPLLIILLGIYKKDTSEVTKDIGAK